MGLGGGVVRCPTTLKGNDILKKEDLFEKHNYREIGRRDFHLLAHYPNGHSSLDWTRLKPGAPARTLHGRLQLKHLGLPLLSYRLTSREPAQKWSSCIVKPALIGDTSMPGGGLMKCTTVLAPGRSLSSMSNPILIDPQKPNTERFSISLIWVNICSLWHRNTMERNKAQPNLK